MSTATTKEQAQAFENLNAALSKDRYSGAMDGMVWDNIDESDVPQFIEDNYPEIWKVLGREVIESYVEKYFQENQNEPQ